MQSWRLSIILLIYYSLFSFFADESIHLLNNQLIKNTIQEHAEENEQTNLYSSEIFDKSTDSNLTSNLLRVNQRVALNKRSPSFPKEMKIRRRDGSIESITRSSQVAYQLYHRRVGFDAGDKVAVKLKVCCRRRSKRLETSLDNNDTKMPALGGYWYTWAIPQLISWDENLLNQGHGSLASLWPESKYCWIPFLRIYGPTAEISAVPWRRHFATIIEDLTTLCAVARERRFSFLLFFPFFFRSSLAFQIIRRILFPSIFYLSLILLIRAKKISNRFNCTIFIYFVPRLDTKEVY